MRRPSIKSPCVADCYHAPNERIAEFSTANGEGGLISIRQLDNGITLVELYNVSKGVLIRIPRA